MKLLYYTTKYSGCQYQKTLYLVIRHFTQIVNTLALLNRNLLKFFSTEKEINVLIYYKLHKPKKRDGKEPSLDCFNVLLRT